MQSGDNCGLSPRKFYEGDDPIGPPGEFLWVANSQCWNSLGSQLAVATAGRGASRCSARLLHAFARVYPTGKQPMLPLRSFLDSRRLPWQFGIMEIMAVRSNLRESRMLTSAVEWTHLSSYSRVSLSGPEPRRRNLPVSPLCDDTHAFCIHSSENCGGSPIQFMELSRRSALCG